MTLAELKTGQRAIIREVKGQSALRQHLLSMGIIPGRELSVKQFAPMGDPIELLVGSYSLSLRLSEASEIEVDIIDAPASKERRSLTPIQFIRGEHPGLGEEGKFHNKKEESSALPKGSTLTFALVGNQNAGKTTLFNQLTGSNQHVGNFPGVTVDRKDGVIKGHPDTLITDLPGIYSLSPYSAEELISRNFVLEQKPKAIINIVDASNIERNLFLTLQLMEMEVPMVIALNMMDEVQGNGGTIYVNEMEKILGLPVVPISARNKEGIEELVQHAVHIAKYQEKPLRNDFCQKDDPSSEAVHRSIHGIMHLIEDHAIAAGIPVRFAACRIAEGDSDILNRLKLSQNEKETVDHLIAQMEEERGMDAAAAIADMRYGFIEKLCAQTVIKPQESKEYSRSRKIDKILTGKYTALPIFFLVIALVIWLSIDLIGAPLQDLLEHGIQALAAIVDNTFARWNVTPAVRSLVADGIFGGVGSVVSFVPIILILFFFLSILEDSGYMARVAFVCDKLLRKLGLSGRSIVPLLIGFGCSVPAIMATRTLPSATDRKTTIWLTPFMSCSAKIPIYAFFTSAFFPQHAGLVLIGLYLLSILIGIIAALVEKWKRKSDSTAPFVMEIPNYRMPTAQNVIRLLWDKCKDFLQRAFTVIFVASIVIWFLQSFDFGLHLVDPEESMLARIAGLIAPIFAPVGLGDWRIVTALVSGFLAKESVVSTMEVLGIGATLTLTSAVPMLIFCLLYTPCIAAIAAVKREISTRSALLLVLCQCSIAWVCALAAHWLTVLFV